MAEQLNYDTLTKARALVQARNAGTVERQMTLPNTGYEVQFLPGTQTTYPRMTTSQILAAYRRLPWLRAVVDKVGKAVGATRWRIFVLRDQQTGRVIRSMNYQNSSRAFRHRMVTKALRRGELEEIDVHPLLEILADGNERFPGSAVLQVTQNHLDLVGEGFWALEMGPLGIPQSIWPVPPDWVKNMPTAEDPFWIINLHGFEYQVPQRNMVFFLDPDPKNPYGRGSGIAEAISDELETDDYAARHTKAFFLNRARPDLIISGDGLGRADTARMEEKWNQQHRGFWNAFKTHFINRKIDVKEVGQSFKDMGLTELRKFERDVVLQVYGVSPEKFGILSQSNRSTIVASDLFWTKDVISSRVELVRNVLQKWVVPIYDSNLILDYESPIVEDSEHVKSIMSAMPAAFAIDEWREEADKPPLGGDIGSMHIIRSGEAIVTEEKLEEEEGFNPSDQLSEPATDTGSEDDDEDAAAAIAAQVIDKITARLGVQK